MGFRRAAVGKRKNRHVSAWIEDELYVALARVAGRAGITHSAAVAEILRKALTR